jgi:hypothetical protein
MYNCNVTIRLKDSLDMVNLKMGIEDEFASKLVTKWQRRFKQSVIRRMRIVRSKVSLDHSVKVLQTATAKCLLQDALDDYNKKRSCFL